MKKRFGVVLVILGLYSYSEVSLVGWAGLIAREELVREAHAAGLVADSAGIGQFHAPLPGEEGLARTLGESFSIPEGHDAQALKSSCLWGCDKFTNGRVMARVDDNVNLPIERFTQAPGLVVAHLTVWDSTQAPDFGLVGSGSGATVHELRLHAVKTSEPEFEATVWRGTDQVKDLDVSFRKDPEGASSPEALQFLWRTRGALFADHPQIGVKCPGGWCFIGPKRGEPEWSASGKKQVRCTTKPGASVRKCVTVFGYHDEQQLAVRRDGNLEPGASWGLVLPEQGLKDLEIGHFESGERLVSTVRIWGDRYKGKLNPGAMLEVYLHRDSSIVNEDQGWRYRIRTIPDDGGTPPADIVSTVTRKGHDGFVLAAARWYWAPNDEGLWIRCGGGCCKLEF